MSRDAARGVQYVAKLTGGRFVSQLILMITAVILPRILGTEDYGTYAAWMALVAMGGGVAILGLPMVETRYLAPLWGLGRRDDAIELGSTILVLKLLLSVVAAVGVALWLTASPELTRGAWVAVLVGLLAFTLYAHEAATSLLLPFARVGALSLFLLLRAVLTLPAVVIGYWLWGVEGVAAGLALLLFLLWLFSWWLLHRVAPLRAASLRWASLGPYVAFAAAAFAANLAWRVQGQFSIYALANWVTPEEAAYLALALQGYNFLQLLVLSARRALTPLLSEMEERGETERTAQWAEFVMRWTAATITLAVLGWSLVGAEVVRLVFTESYAPVHRVAAWILLCALCYGCAESSNMLLYVAGRAGRAAVTMTVYTVATIAGLLIALRGPQDGTAVRAAMAYAAAAVLYFAVSYVILARSTGTRLPLRSTVLLALPAAAAPFLTAWDAGLTFRIAALGLILVVYGAAGVGLGLVPREGLLVAIRRLRARVESIS